ncbi:hypothetical protein FBU30_004159 [Linnemannia zychae]|nr:hypothetical protein FBU30_004159 [Linnemannia zychae]
MPPVPPSHLKWFKETNQRGAPSFFEEFGYDREEGRRHYLRLITWSTLGKSLRKKLEDEFRRWEANDADQYWLLRQSKSTKTKIATLAIKESEPISTAALQNSTAIKNLENDAINTISSSTTTDSTSTSEITSSFEKENEPDETINTLNDLSPSTSSSPAAGQKRPRDTWGDREESKNQRRALSPSSTQTSVDQEEEEDIDDLESADIAHREHPFFFIFRALYDLHYRRSLKMPPRASNLSVLQGKLFSFIVPKLTQFHSLKRLQKKDIFVASSMIVHLEHDEAEDAYGKDLIDKLAPLIIDTTFSEADEMTKVILNKVEQAAISGNKKFDPRRIRLCVTKELGILASDELNGVLFDEHNQCVLEILRLLARKCERSFAEIPKETESMTVRVWEDVFDLLFEGSAVSVTTGETGLVASREERKANEQVHGGVDTPISPRKVDFLLLTSVEHQRKLVHIEIADYEHKGSLATDEEVAVQLRKSIRHNHAILTRLHVLDEIIFLDIKGYTAQVVRLRRHESVFICGTMTDDIVLPTTPAQLKYFLDGRSLSALFHLRDHVLEAAAKVQESILKPKGPPLLARTITPPPAPRTPTFYTPSTKRNK